LEGFHPLALDMRKCFIEFGDKFINMSLLDNNIRDIAIVRGF
jgi:hypothetical protein